MGCEFSTCGTRAVRLPLALAKLGQQLGERYQLPLELLDIQTALVDPGRARMCARRR